MAKLRDVCLDIRSKNAGPYWITVDLFFDSPETYRKYRDNPAIGPAAFGALYEVDPAMIKHFPVDSLNMIKISYPRATAQGGMLERDMHGGQQYVRLLDVEMDGNESGSDTRDSLAASRAGSNEHS
jgi:hypothetical protein